MVSLTSDPEVVKSLQYLSLLNGKNDQIKPFDDKVNRWISDPQEGFIPVVIKSTKANEAIVSKYSGELLTVKNENLFEMNPPDYEKCEDLADLAHLNDATILHNLRARYHSNYIYTLSGLFFIAINPYLQLPIYSKQMISYYHTKRRPDAPPHLYLVSEKAYTTMLREKENQSILMTGESGAGKTETTKKVIQFFTFISSQSNQDKVTTDKRCLEDQIISANSVLEAYANAKTARNNNSSRFGKFIRIHFGVDGKISGADIETYLLEKSRVTFHKPNERNFHIFYQLLAFQSPELKNELFLENDPKLYSFISRGLTAIEEILDSAEMKITDEAFRTLQFKQEEKLDLYKCTASILHLGNSKWKGNADDEQQAETDGADELDKFCSLVGIDTTDLVRGLLNPRVKVGAEFVNKAQSVDQVAESISTLSKSIYSRCFSWLVSQINKTLNGQINQEYFIGILDITGFDVFEQNGFEQLCINFSNEKLQQVFNNYMFIFEQEEYKREKIAWDMVNFGFDLQACIDLIEKPMGIFSILDEECLIPKATDTTLKEKLLRIHGRHANFTKSIPDKDNSEAHFDLKHYAGIVSYNTTGWLDTNKDQVNTTVAELFKNSKTNKLLSFLYQDIGATDKYSKAKKKTISSLHRDQLNKLIQTLNSTQPHFIRCIIPNETKSPGIFQANLVMHQLRCNGILEGIRISCNGFSTRLIYAEFKRSFGVLAPNVNCTGAPNDYKKLTITILKEIQLDYDLYRLGLTKVFFRVGVISKLENLRQKALSKIITMFQSQIKAYLARKCYKLMLEQKVAMVVLRRNAKKYITFKEWEWWNLFTMVKPLLHVARKEDELKAKEQEFEKVIQAFEKEESLRKDFELQNSKLTEDKIELNNKLSHHIELLSKEEQLTQAALQQNETLHMKIKSLEIECTENKLQIEDILTNKGSLVEVVNDLKKEIVEKDVRIAKKDEDVKSRDNQVKIIQEVVYKREEYIAKLERDKKRLEDVNQSLTEQLLIEEDKYSKLNKIKVKIEQLLDESEIKLEREQKLKNEIDKSKRKSDSSVKTFQLKLEDLEKKNVEIEKSLKLKESELNIISIKFEEERAQVNILQKKLKDVQSLHDSVNEEVQMERQLKVKAEIQRADLHRELEEMSLKLDEIGGFSKYQNDVNKKRESEMAQLRNELEAMRLQYEYSSDLLAKKIQDITNELNSEKELNNRAFKKLETEKVNLKKEIEEKKVEIEAIDSDKLNLEKLNKQYDSQIQELKSKLSNSVQEIHDLDIQKRKLKNENNDSFKQFDDLSTEISKLARDRQNISDKLDESNRHLEAEAQAKSLISSQYRNLMQEFEALKLNLNDEQILRSEFETGLIKEKSEMQRLRAKFEADGLSLAEELDAAKKKFSVKLNEADDKVEQAIVKCNGLEKGKLRLQSEIEDLMVDVDKANTDVTIMEKKQRILDKTITDWKLKSENIVSELEESQREVRQFSADNFRLKSQLEEKVDNIEAVNRENKKLGEEVKELISQLGEEERKYHDLESLNQRVINEKQELQVQLEDAEGNLEKEEAKFSKLNLEMAQLRQENERKIHEKEEEMGNVKRTHQRVVESMQASLDVESLGKAELVKVRKNLEAEVISLERSLDEVTKSLSDTIKLNKNLESVAEDLRSHIDEEQKQCDDMKLAAESSERRANLLLIELELVRGSLEEGEKNRRKVEMELHDLIDQHSDLNTEHQCLLIQKRKLEKDMSELNIDIDETCIDLKNSEENVKRVSEDVVKLAEEFRREQENCTSLVKQKKSLEHQIKDLQTKLVDAEEIAIKDIKRITEKLENKIQAVEGEYEVEQRFHRETQKEARILERKLKESAYQTEQDRQNYLRLQETVDQLQKKLKTFKRQTEEAEEIANLNIGKFRLVQHELEEVTERANYAESIVAKVKASNRHSMSHLRDISPPKGLYQSRASSVISRSGSLNRR